MPVEDDVLRRAELSQLESWRSERARMQGEQQVLARLAICLCRMVGGDLEVSRAGGHLVVSDEEMQSAPVRFVLKVDPTSLREDRELEAGEEEVPEERMWLVQLLPRDGSHADNGKLVVPGGPRIVTP